MRAVACGLLLFLPVAALAQAKVEPQTGKEMPTNSEVTIDDLHGTTIHTSSTFTALLRSEKGEAPGGFTLRRELKITHQGDVQVKFARDIWWDSPSGRKTGRLAGTDAGKIGQPIQGSDGPRLFTLQGNTLSMLRVHQVGGHVLKITLRKDATGLSCSSDSKMAREVGAGDMKTTALGGGKAEVRNARQISSTCKVQSTK